MESYVLSRLGPQSFERLVRALAFRVFGPAGIVFPSGPDAGRDFAIEGRIKGYESRGWDGYLVLQAKFKLNSDTPDGVPWLVDQIRKEQSKFLDKRLGRRLPRYYILATNVALSGADGITNKGLPKFGGLSKIEAEMDHWKSSLRLEDYDIWPHDKLIDLLSDAADIRQTFASWVTSGDVLSAALQSIKPQRLSFTSVIRRSVKTNLRRDQYAKLKDAGSVSEQQIRTSQVFIDLPVEGSDDLLISEIVQRAKNIFSMEKIPNTSDASKYRNNKIVILGGPGQGKSTASTFLAQIFRAAILSDDPSFKMDENVAGLIPEILNRAESEGISTALPRRYPVLISLPRYADSVSAARDSKHAPPSLLAHIALELSSACDDEVERGDLRLWLSKHPWIIVLDGLDEVPPSGERAAVLDGIAGLLTEINEASGDCLLIVTTRPQGYNQDFDPDVWEHWRLADLPTERSLAYAKALGIARYPEDPYRRNQILNTLGEATQKPATSRLMKSPLQVTIMQLIVDTGGSVPAARWSLFHEYFDVLKKREKAKGGETQKILERNWSLLGSIHQRAGLILQVESEEVGGATAGLTHDRFKRLLEDYLIGLGFEGADVAERVKDLMEVSLHRLVLLATKEEGVIGFDVRSLQEFMAAAALTSDSGGIMEERLNHIAGIAHWRHVLLIAASRCFSDDAFYHRRSSVVSIPRALETSDVDAAVRNGARLALEMFIDGIGLDHPISRRQLAQHALECLALGSQEMDARLVQLWEPVTKALFKASVRERVSEMSGNVSAAASMLVMAMLRENIPEFIDEAENSWPADDRLACGVLNWTPFPLPTIKLANQVRDVMIKGGPVTLTAAASSFLHSLNKSEILIPPGHDEIMELDPSRFKSKQESIGVLGTPPHPTLSTKFLSVDCGGPLSPTPIDGAPDWNLLKTIAVFRVERSHKALAKALATIGHERNLEAARRLESFMPWPMASLLRSARHEGDLSKLAARVSSGEFGELQSWRQAEARWRDQGITSADLRYCSNGEFFGADIDRVGCPGLSHLSISMGRQDARDIVIELARISSHIGATSGCGQSVARAVEVAAIGIGPENRIEAEADCLVVLEALERIMSGVYLDAVEALHSAVWIDEELVPRLNEVCLKCRWWSGDRGLQMISPVISAFQKDNQRRGLLHIIAMVAAQSKVNPIIDDLWKSDISVIGADPPEVRASIGLLGLIDPWRNGIRVDEVVGYIMEDDSGFGLRLAEQFLGGEIVEPELRREVIHALLRVVEVRRPMWGSRLRELLRRSLDARRSHLARRNTWIDKLQLPADAFSILEAG